MPILNFLGDCIAFKSEKNSDEGDYELRRSSTRPHSYASIQDLGKSSNWIKAARLMGDGAGAISLQSLPSKT
jgi:hypothetical protein